MINSQDPDTDIATRYEPALSSPPGRRFSPFLEGARQQELRLPRCERCARFHWYPLPRCPHCGMSNWRWQRVSPLARLFAWTVLRKPLHESLANRLGEIIALVVPVDAPDVRLVTNLIGVTRPELGMLLQARFVPAGGTVLTLFAPVEEEG